MNARRIPAKALLITIVIILLITAITSSLVLYFYFQQQIWNNTVIEVQLQSDVDAGILLMMKEEAKVSSLTDTGYVIDLYQNEEHIVTMNKQQWGAFYLVRSLAKKRNITKEQVAFAGYPLKDTLTALYLSDQHSPLVFTDQSQIVGDCYLPRLGYKRAYFEGKTYRTDNIINSDIKESDKELPKLDSSILNSLTNYKNLILQGNLSYFRYQDLVDDSLEQSFSKQPLIFHSSHNYPKV